MSRYQDSSSDIARWTNRKLIAELRRVANFKDFGGDFNSHLPLTADNIREETRLYRDSWMNPIIEVLADRLKVKEGN